MKTSLRIIGTCLIAYAFFGIFRLDAQEFTVTYGGQVARTWDWSDGSRDRITLNAAGTVTIRPHQITCDGQSFSSSTADLVTVNHVWGTAIEDGSTSSYTFNFDVPRPVSRSPSSTYSHFTPVTADYLYLETRDEVEPSPDDITVYAWEYVSNQNVMRMWVALPDPFYYPDASYEHYDFPASHVVANASSAHSWLFGTVVDSQGAYISGAQITLGGVARTSDGNGAFQYDDIPPGTYGLTIAKAGLRSVSSVETIPAFSILHQSYTLGCTAVSNVRARQRPGTRLVDILYDLEDSGNAGVLADVQISANGVQIPASHFSGKGYGFGVVPGNNRAVVWEAGIDWPKQVSSDVVFSVVIAGCEPVAVAATSPPTAVDTREGDRPVVQDVTSPYCASFQHAYFLDGVVPFFVPFTAIVDWNGRSPGSIQFLTSGNPHDPVEGPENTRTYNVGSDFGLGGGLTVRAVADDGTESVPYRVNFDVISPLPLVSAATLMFLNGIYALKQSIPWPLLHGGVASVPNDDSGKSMPGITGKPLLFDCSLEYQGEIGLDGTWNAKLSLEAESPSWKLLGAEIKPKGMAGIEGRFGNGSWMIGGYGGFGVSFEYTSLPVYFWDLPPISSKWGMSLEQNVEGHIDFDAVKGLELNGEFPGEFSLKPTTGVGLNEVVCLNLFASGGPYWTFQWPHPAGLKELGVKLSGGVEWVVWGKPSVRSLERSWKFIGPDNMGAGSASAGILDLRPPPLSTFTRRSRDFLNAPYSALAAGAGARSRAKPNDRPLPRALTEDTIQSNVFPYSEPSLAVCGTNRMLLWIWDDPARSTENGTELVWSKWNGTSWSKPASVWNDATADFTPTARLFADGSVLAVWQNERAVLPDGADLSDMAQGMEIAAASFDPVSDAWTATNLTANLCLDRSPHLATAGNGKALLTWISNPGNDLLGSTNASNIIRSRLWTGGTWLDVGDIATNVPMLFWSTVAFDGTNGVFLAAVDGDGDESTAEDQEIYGATFNGLIWSSLIPLTTNGLQDTRPQAVYDRSGQLLVCWYQGSNIVMRAGDLNLGSPNIIPAPGAVASSKDFRLVTGSNGEISILWEDLAQDGTGPDPFLLNYDPNLKIWSQPLRLLNNRDQLERSFSAAYDTNGTLLAAYDRVAISVDSNNVPSLGQADLMLLECPIGSDLSVDSSDITLSIPNPAPRQGVDIAAIIRNVGELAMTNVQAAFYDSNPNAGGAMIGSMQTVPGVLAAGGTAPVQVHWVVPQTTTPRPIYVVIDPAQTQQDRDRGNNTASLNVMAPDLAISSITVRQPTAASRIVNARVGNIGVLPTSSRVAVTFHQSSTNGPILATVSIPGLAVGAQYDASFTWNLSALTITSAVDVVYAVVA